MPSGKRKTKGFMFTSKQFVERKEEIQEIAERFIAKSAGRL